MGFFDVLKIGLLFAEESRLPFRLKTGVHGDPPTISITLINRLDHRKLYVDSVRIHYGIHGYSTCFLLSPEGTHEIEAGGRKEFWVSFPGARMKRRFLVNLVRPGWDNFPTFESPADLFKAIANGRKKDSWIEIDFDEFRKKHLRLGQVQRLFVTALAMSQVKTT